MIYRLETKKSIYCLIHVVQRISANSLVTLFPATLISENKLFQFRFTDSWRFFKDETRFLRTLSCSCFFTINHFAPSQTFYFPYSITFLFFVLELMFPQLVCEIAPQKRKKPDPSILVTRHTTVKIWRYTAPLRGPFYCLIF